MKSGEIYRHKKNFHTIRIIEDFGDYITIQEMNLDTGEWDDDITNFAPMNLIEYNLYEPPLPKVEGKVNRLDKVR